MYVYVDVEGGADGEVDMDSKVVVDADMFLYLRYACVTTYLCNYIYVREGTPWGPHF